MRTRISLLPKILESALPILSSARLKLVLFFVEWWGRATACGEWGRRWKTNQSCHNFFSQNEKRITENSAHKFLSHTRKKKKNGKKPCSKKKKECEGNNDETQGE
jgi:hypothetical protein